MGASGQAEARGPIPGGDASGGHSKAPYYREVGENEHEEDPRRKEIWLLKQHPAWIGGQLSTTQRGGPAHPPQVAENT